jgi:hypothetical protein
VNTSVALAIDAPADLSGLRHQFVEKLDAAHRHIEERFTAGGEALMTVMDVINRLITSLDSLTSALDGETAAAAMDSIRQTTARLSTLPDCEIERGGHFREISSVCGDLAVDVAAMREIMRYLLSIAMTVKITGAHLPDFSDFADEIRDRTQSGSQEVETFVRQLGQVKAEIERACEVSDTMINRYSQVLPGLVEALDTNNARIAQEHRAMARLAAEVRTLAGSVQAKISSVLTNLQIGDITRQRIEHMRSAFAILDAFLEEHPDFAPADVLHCQALLVRLCSHHMDETLQEFRSGSARVMTGMTGLSNDAQLVLSTRNSIVGVPGSGNTSAMRTLRSNVAAAHRLVSAVEKSGVDAAEIAASAATRTSSLLDGIGTVQQTEIDIHFMALNATLRCSKLGDAGRSVNVVSAELRTFAAALEVPARSIVGKLKKVQEISERFGEDGAGNRADSISIPLQAALDLIDQACSRIDDSLATFAAEAESAFSTIGRSFGSLDLDTGLGDELRECRALLDGSSMDHTDDAGPAAGHFAELGRRIFQIYTMAQERNVHLNHFPPAQAEEPVESEDLDDVLF